MFIQHDIYLSQSVLADAVAALYVENCDVDRAALDYYYWD